MQLNLILKPVITEKATAAEKGGKYQFFVRHEANKIEIRKLFEKLYGVAVKKINVLRTPKKFKSGRTRVPLLKKHEMKKIIITTKAKKTLDITKPKYK